MIEKVSHQWKDPDHGIWEPRAGKRHNVHSKMMCWLALDRGAGIASVFGATDARDAWESAAAAVVDEVCARGLDSKGRHFVAAYGHDHADAALLLLPIHGFLPDDHPLMHETVDWVRKELGTGPFVHRYRTDDGVGGARAPSSSAASGSPRPSPCRAASKGPRDLRRPRRVLQPPGPPRRELDPTTREQLGNFPQAFSHLGLINAALRIDLGLRLRDEGTGKTPHLITDAPASRGPRSLTLPGP
ncbi:MAG: glycoside hydrolase family 15 protein [Polyangiaceae bacterium]